MHVRASSRVSGNASISRQPGSRHMELSVLACYIESCTRVWQLAVYFRTGHQSERYFGGIYLFFVSAENAVPSYTRIPIRFGRSMPALQASVSELSLLLIYSLRSGALQ